MHQGCTNRRYRRYVGDVRHTECSLYYRLPTLLDLFIKATTDPDNLTTGASNVPYIGYNCNVQYDIKSLKYFFEKFRQCAYKNGTN